MNGRGMSEMVLGGGYLVRRMIGNLQAWHGRPMRDHQGFHNHEMVLPNLILVMAIKPTMWTRSEEWHGKKQNFGQRSWHLMIIRMQQFQQHRWQQTRPHLSSKLSLAMRSTMSLLIQSLHGVKVGDILHRLRKNGKELLPRWKLLPEEMTMYSDAFRKRRRVWKHLN